MGLLHGAALAEMRVWTNTRGQLIEAEMFGVNVEKRAVKLRLKNGLEFDIAIDTLSPPDKAFAREKWEVMSQAPASAAPFTVSGEALSSLPESFRPRLDPVARLEAIHRGGGTPAMEVAVVKSLRSFKSIQNHDGSWAHHNKGGMTGFALQCFLGHGETPDSQEFGSVVVNGILYLIDLGKKNPHGLYTEKWSGGPGGNGSYEHAIATTAVGEAYILARLGTRSLPGIRESFVTAIETIISQQTSNGSWSYRGQTTTYNPLGNDDLSLASWHFQALNVARASGLKFDGLDNCIEKALKYINSTQTKDGGFGGKIRDAHYNQWSLSGGATAGHLMLSAQSTEEAKKGVQFIASFLKDEPPDWNKNCNLYSWYDYGNAFFLSGGPEWGVFVAQVMPQIVAAQEVNGSFKRGRPNWPAADAADAIYRQALCTLMLERFYR
jgi:hypothetical protein